MLMYIHVNVVFELLYKNIAIIELPILSATKVSHYTYCMCHCVVGGILIKYPDSVCSGVSRLMEMVGQNGAQSAPKILSVN